MRWFSALRALFIALVFSAVSAAGASAAPPMLYHHSSLEVDVGLFYDDLAPHGQWVETDYGWTFVPRVATSWRPYTVGHWVWTDDYGWLWVSDEEFGWATCHYGRWYSDPVYGWAWVPGDVWAPAWVSFRSGGGYYGWAPLSPRVAWDASIGFRVGAVELDTYIQPNYYTFVPERSFLEARIDRVAVPATRSAGVFRETRNVTSFNVAGDRVINRSLSVDSVQRATGRAVPRVRAVEVGSVRDAHHARVHGDQVQVFRPRVQISKDETPPHGQAMARRQERRQQPEPAPNLKADRGGRSTAAEKPLRAEPEQTAKQRAADQKQEAQMRRNEEKSREAERRQADRQRAADEKQRRSEEKRQADLKRSYEKQRQADQREADKRVTREREDHERQRQQLEKRQAAERSDMERQHKREIKNPPRVAASESLDQRHQREHQALEERQHRERQQVETRREERQAREAQPQKRSAEARQQGGDKRQAQPPKKEKPQHKPPDKP